MSDAIVGTDGLARCPWGAEPEIYRVYHDREWGRPVHGDDAVFERLTLEAFQSGLSWLTVLRKRQAFRDAFAGFAIEKVAAYSDDDVVRLLGNADIIRNRAKIEAAIVNAQVARDLDGSVSELVWSFQPDHPRSRPRTFAEIPSTTPESTALAKRLKKLGFRFVGPTTCYAMMQAIGMVDDHLVDCHRSGAIT
ncbi:DNA-3-methyladenine glycosylase I [Haloglycomyces albus]|uniref:DNA-3-methyladenine glycosylase I n=1 Tax=Haloglycomyces albus TaxID=526067 RepID=UPI00046D66A2|nr:DNA-3-methyladenine glycosylase I [Haloglycomyces albus]